jgi:hypothetical protein
VAEQLVALSDLKARFSQFAEIANITGRLNVNLNEIHTQNRNAAGRDDSIAQTYHQQVDKPTSDLHDLVDGIRKLFGITGDTGTQVADEFRQTEDNAVQIANNLQ